MGRHRRSAAGRAATGRATEAGHTDGPSAQGHDPLDPPPADRPARGSAPYLSPEAYAEACAKSDAYLFGTDDAANGAPAEGPGQDGTGPASHPGDGFGGSGGFTPDPGTRRAGARRRRKKKDAAPVRTGLLGVSAAVAIGAVAVTSGVVPGLDNYRLGNGTGDQVRSADLPANTPTEQGGTSGSAESEGGTATSPGTGGSGSPSSPASTPSPSASSPSASSASPSGTPSRSAGPDGSRAAKEPAEPDEPAPSGKPTASAGKKTAPAPSRTATREPERSGAPVTVSREAAAEAEVLRLVNQERAKVGCSPLAANSALAGLAGDFSDAMAEQGFFDHTDPSGATPWDRAEKAGISNLGGENIARGQADAQAVMESWMNSPGHRANILNCDFTTLGVGVHFGSGGPWWTQDFGY
ncbi:CAP domain-containing protein [Streptomyces sp. NPDC006134]|uniref:CAP domain-containing protein n=1 Tax=Streptomyces sp. NPDC006134 TaxID=3154467 RepID=UPI0033F1774D